MTTWVVQRTGSVVEGSLDLAFMQSGAGAIPRRLTDKVREYPASPEDFGAFGDGSSDDKAAIDAACAASLAPVVYIPSGSYLYAGSNFGAALGSKRLAGPGQVVTGTNRRAPYFSAISSSPTSSSSSSIDSAFNGDLSKVQFAIEHRITGAATLGQPSSGYLYTPEAYAIYGYLFNSSGYNASTSVNSGRTAAVFSRVKVYQAGQGDCMAYNASAFVTGSRSGATSFLANPAASLFTGDISAGNAGVYLNPYEIGMSDGGYDVAGIGHVVNMTRSNGAGSLGAVWIGTRLQSVGPTDIDTFYSAYGKGRYGLDLTGCTLSEAAIVLKADDKVYGNAQSLTSKKYIPSSLGSEWFKYSSSLSAWQFAVSGNSVFEMTSSSIKAIQPLIMMPGSNAPALDLNGQVVLELTNNTTLNIKARGSDGSTRSASLTLS